MTYNSAQDALADLKKVPQQLALTVTERRRKVAEIKNNDRLSAMAKDADIHAVSKEASENVDRIMGRAKSAQDYINGVVNSSDDGQMSDQARLVRELQEQRAWARAERYLSSGRDAFAVIDTAKDDPVALSALRKELPSYVEAGFAGGAQELQRYLEGLNSYLDQATEPYMSDTDKLKKQLQYEVKAGAPRLEMGESLVRAELAGGSPAMIPAWSDTPGDPTMVLD